VKVLFAMCMVAVSSPPSEALNRRLITVESDLQWLKLLILSVPALPALGASISAVFAVMALILSKVL
jgi:hypothetical protein